MTKAFSQFSLILLSFSLVTLSALAQRSELGSGKQSQPIAPTQPQPYTVQTLPGGVGGWIANGQVHFYQMEIDLNENELSCNAGFELSCTKYETIPDAVKERAQKKFRSACQNPKTIDVECQCWKASAQSIDALSEIYSEVRGVPQVRSVKLVLAHWKLKEDGRPDTRVGPQREFVESCH